MCRADDDDTTLGDDMIFCVENACEGVQKESKSTPTMASVVVAKDFIVLRRFVDG